MPSSKDQKERFYKLFKKSPLPLGIINHTAQYPLCRARHNGNFYLKPMSALRMWYTIVQTTLFRLPEPFHFIQNERFYPGEIRR